MLKKEVLSALKVGEKVSFTKTVGESDIYLFAGITGDFSPNHVNEVFMSNTKYGTRIAHGNLIIGYMSTASTLMGVRHREKCPSVVRVNYGYDRVRFLKPVFIGDTISVEYKISLIDDKKDKIFADIKVTNQRGDLVAIATNIIKVIDF